MPDVERLTYRTIKELVTNAGKHSGATHVTVAVSCDDAHVTGVVEDDGRGFDAAAVEDARKGFHIGLTTAADRVRLAGGRLEVSTAPDRGTSARFTLPIAGSGRLCQAARPRVMRCRMPRRAARRSSRSRMRAIRIRYSRSLSRRGWIGFEARYMGRMLIMFTVYRPFSRKLQRIPLLNAFATGQTYRWLRSGEHAGRQ